ncbi:hypothetical protein BT67DRAFT_430878 [Trichocladium antarcticum]|uniref:Synaptobrevin n=1 Tax=Trichocladium antarcticum TaxID=1450529 RepID=A0AAN6USQ6_9PEZI|nr:hypothetical protein BT67DRAFT_430878 [Trichocladium antarcticum]
MVQLIPGRTILHADAEREARLRASEFEREKSQANINYARSLLTTLEQDALTIKIHARRQDVQAELAQKREVLDQLSERLGDLAEFAAAGDDSDDDDDGEDLLADIIATPSESMASTGSPDTPPAAPAPSTTTTAAISTQEAILDHHRAEQDALSESILKLASDLKLSSQAFSASLDQDRALVDRAGQGIARTGERMAGVTRRLGVLTRMTEGEGWWGRMRLYAIVWGLMVVLVLVVGVLPKLRF